jgi:hypothetical protein
LLFSPQDAIALSQQLQRLISDRSLAHTLAQQGYGSAKSNFALDTILASFARAIAEV